MDDDVDFPRSIGRPATGALREAGYTRTAQLDGVAAKDLLALHGVGPKAVRLLHEALVAQGGQGLVGQARRAGG